MFRAKSSLHTQKQVKQMKKMIALTLGLSMTLSAQAHMLWLERDTDKQTHAFFGEYSEQLKETQQGALKSFNQAKAEEIAHDTFFKVYRYKKKYDPEKTFRT